MWFIRISFIVSVAGIVRTVCCFAIAIFVAVALAYLSGLPLSILLLDIALFVFVVVFILVSFLLTMFFLLRLTFRVVRKWLK